MVALNVKLPICVHRLVIGAEDSAVVFQVMPESSMGKLGNSSFQIGDIPKESITVEMKTIDTLLAENAIPPADLIKIDVEGAEVMVLKGGLTFIAKRRPIMFIEVHSRELARECVELLKGYDYDFFVLETGAPPDFVSEPEVCHLQASPRPA